MREKLNKMQRRRKTFKNLRENGKLETVQKVRDEREEEEEDLVEVTKSG